MPIYSTDVPGLGVLEINSPTPLDEEELNRLAQEQIRQRRGETAATPSYLERLGQRVSEAGAAAADIPASALGVVTGGDEGRIPAALRLAQGVASPVSVLLSPVEAAAEHAAAGAGLSPTVSRHAGDVSGILATLGTGLLAKAGKLGETGMKVATALGVGVPATQAEALRQPQFRYAATQPSSATTALEQLVNIPEVPAADLAMAARSPITAEAMLARARSRSDVWREHAKANNILGEIPPEPRMVYKDIMEFQPPRINDQGIFGTLGTPTAQAAAIHPKGAQVAYDLADSEMLMRRAIDARTSRNEKALLVAGDKTLLEAVKWRNVKDLDDILANPKISGDVKKVVQFLNDKFEVDRQVAIPRLRSIEEVSVRKAIEKEEALKPAASRLDPVALAAKVQDQVERAVPGDLSIEDILLRVFPSYYRITDKRGAFLESANNKREAAMKIKELADERGLKASDFKIKQRAIFDSDTLHIFQGRVSRAMEAMAKDLGFTPAEVEAATRGDFSLHAPSKFFNQFLGRDAKGYTKDMMNALGFYDRTLERWKAVSGLEERVKPLLRELGDRGYRRLVDTLYTSLNHLKGYRSPAGEYVDNTIAGTPVLRSIVSPYILERSVNALRGGIISTYLRFNPRFHAVNATQVFSTLWPELRGELGPAYKLWNSEAGRTLLERHGVSKLGTRIEEFGKGLGPIERANQEFSFIALYNRGRRLGLTDDQAGVYGRLRGNLFTQFTGLVTDVPKAFRTIDPLGLGTMFLRFPVKNTELLLDLVKNHNFPGVAKWLGVNLLLGGFKAATLGEAGWLTYDLYNKLKANYGETVADVFHAGLPALVGVDVSNSVMLYNPPFGETWAEKAGNLLGGPLGGMLSSALGAASATAVPEPSAAKRMFDGLINAIPLGRQLVALANLLEGDYDIKDPLGRLKYKAELSDVVKRIGGFRPLKEATLDTWISAMLEMRERRDTVLNYAASRYGQARAAGITLGDDMEALIQREVDTWNNLWPEFPITGDSIAKRTAARQRTAVMSLRERMLKAAPAVFRRSEQFSLPPGGG